LISVSCFLNFFPQSPHVVPTGSVAAVGVIGAKAGGWFRLLFKLRMAFAVVARTCQPE